VSAWLNPLDHFFVCPVGAGEAALILGRAQIRTDAEITSLFGPTLIANRSIFVARVPRATRNTHGGRTARSGSPINRESNAAGIVWKSKKVVQPIFGPTGENGSSNQTPGNGLTRERSLPGQDARMALIIFLSR